LRVHGGILCPFRYGTYGIQFGNLNAIANNNGGGGNNNNDKPQSRPTVISR